jgi:hypothetical protein
VWLTGSILAVELLFMQIERINQPEGIKKTVFGIKALLVKELGLDDWNCIDGILHCFYIGFQYLGLNQSGGLNTGIVGF